MFTVAITVMVFMLIKVVPIFAEMYEGMGVALPTPTAVIMSASDFMRGTGGMTLLFGSITFFVIFKYLTTKVPTIRYKWHGSFKNACFWRHDFKISNCKNFIDYG